MEDVLTCYETNQIPPPADADGVAGRTDAGWKIYQRQTMKLTKENILALNPCHIGLVFAESRNFDAVKIWNTCPRGDWMIWLLRQTQSIDRQTSVKLACLWAEHVLSIYESKYPDDKRPRLAIEAAKAWADNPTDEKLALVKLAADEAWKARRADAAAADAAAAAYAAAYAAYAAYAAAAFAAAAAADVAADVAAERKWQADKIRELIPCPFENL